MSERQNRPLDPVGFVDCVHLKVCDGQVPTRATHTALAVTVDGNRDILELWAEYGGEGAKYRLQVLTTNTTHGFEDMLMLVGGAPKGLPNSVAGVWSVTIMQTCMFHLIRESFRYIARKDWNGISRALKPVYQAQP